ncbi:G-protein coupled receptor 4-like [Arapaima gigas]
MKHARPSQGNECAFGLYSTYKIDPQKSEQGHTTGGQTSRFTAENQMPTQPTTMNVSTNNQTCVDLSATSSGNLLMVIYILAFVLGVITNLFTLGPIVQQVRNHNVLGVYLLNLALSDLLYIFTMPLWIHYFYNKHHWSLNAKLCELAGFVFYSNMYISIGLLCCISIDRCLTVLYPLKARIIRRSCYAWIICATVSLGVMFLHFLILVFDEHEDSLDENYRCYEHYPIHKAIARFNLIRGTLGFICPLLVLSVCYWQIFSKVQCSHGVGQQAKQKVRKLSVAVIAIFSICFAPYHFLLIARSVAFFSTPVNNYCDFEKSIHLYFSCALAMSSLNSVIDPVLYVLSSNGVKEDIQHCLIRFKQDRQETSTFVVNHVQPYSFS